MFSILAERLAEAYVRPRASARRILSAAPSRTEALLLAAAGFAFFELLSRLMQISLGVTTIEALASIGQLSQEQIAQKVAATKSVAYLISNLGWHMLETVIAAYLAWRLGGLAGGGASFRQLLGLAGWWALVSVPAMAIGQLFLLLSPPGALALGMVAMLAATLYILYMLAAFLAEAHGFESEGTVFIALLGVTFALITVAAMFVNT